MMRFADRRHAGQRLAEALRRRVPRDAIVYALPRGGVPVAVEVALALMLPLDLVIPRKIGHPFSPEYGIAAVTETGEPVCNEAELARIDRGWFDRRVREERREAQRRRERYCEGRPRRRATDCCAVLIDDGIATGLTMEAAVREIQADRPRRVVVAVAVSPAETRQRFSRMVDDFVAVQVPEYCAGAVGSYYVDFRQTTDEDVMRELARLPQAETVP